MDYISRFGLELVLLTIALVAISTNIYLFSNHAQAAASADQSVIFSFAKANLGDFNTALLADTDTTTIVVGSDQQVTKAPPESEAVLASAQTADSVLTTDPTTIQDDVALKTNPADSTSYPRAGLTTYTVQPNDTPCGIASNVGISCETLLQSNNLTAGSVIQPGQSLTILPTTGITYTIKSGDTLDGILSKYKISEDEFLDANNLESFDDLAVGAIVVIPLDSVGSPSQPATQFVKNDTGQVPLTTATTPADLTDSPVSFIWPTYKWVAAHPGQPAPENITPGELPPVNDITQGFSSRHTGLDISDSQREPIYASADGYVEIAGYQTNGYGNTLLINDGSGFKTRYGHATELYVKAGDYVKQGQLIAEQGNTGRTQGPTGIHLHFEIIKDGTRVTPLDYVSP